MVQTIPTPRNCLKRSMWQFQLFSYTLEQVIRCMEICIAYIYIQKGVFKFMYIYIGQNVYKTNLHTLINSRCVLNRVSISG